jgi:hypothetical protein
VKSKIIVVGMDDGIILDLNRCVILDESALSVNEKTLLDTGTEMEALTIAERHGVSLRHIMQGCGYGDLHYGNSFPLTPIMLRTEFSELPSLFPEQLNNDTIVGVKEMRETLAWGASLSDEQLHHIAQDVLQDDELWSQWRASVIESLLSYKATITESQES